MPPAVRARYTEAERAALSVIADQCKRKGFCGLCLDEIGRLAGVSRTSVQNAIRKARSKGLEHISVRERPQERGKSLTNIIKIVCASWLGWIARAIGFKRLHPSETTAKISLSKPEESVKWAFEMKQEETSQAKRLGCEPVSEETKSWRWTGMTDGLREPSPSWRTLVDRAGVRVDERGRGFNPLRDE
jgi:biotin operon repressor